MEHGNFFRILKHKFPVAFLAIILSACSDNKTHEPPKPKPEDAEDTSGLREPIMTELPSDLEDTNKGAFEGGIHENKKDARVNNVFSEAGQQYNKRFNVPTHGAPSPLMGATPFSQRLLRFEEFGTKELSSAVKKIASPLSLPVPKDTKSMPEGAKLDEFLLQDIYPAPTRWANTVDTNPWEKLIEGHIGRDLNNPPIEGRPPGESWAHQRWDDFAPKRYFSTAQTGARPNLGMRDKAQTHSYSKGEFAEGGLYHNTVGAAGFEGTTKGIEVRLHPDLPEQTEHTVWTFDGTFPPKLLKVRYGEPTLMRHHNALPVDVAANRGFGLHTISTHEHNGHNPAESDGYTNAFFFPGQFYDYRWPIALAGHDSINVDASDPKAGSPDGKGGITKIPGDWRETMSTHWFHDHMLDFTAQNVYKGNAAMMNYYSALDRGNEAVNDGVNLRLPSGSALDWGNRDYDVNLLLADKAWDDEGQLWFNPFNEKGFIGDIMTVNWLYKPYFEVRARKYRFRLLNGSVSRYFKLALINEGGDAVPFYLVANDGNIMEHTVYFENGQLPTMGIAERYDIIVDFSKFKAGDKLYLVNLLQHKDGQATDKVIPLDEVISGIYEAETLDDNGDGIADRWSADPVVGKFLEFRVKRYEGRDLSFDPAEFVAGKKKLIPLRRPTQEELDNALHRSFEFERQATDESPWVIETDGGKGYTMDPRRLTAAPRKNTGGLEVWRLYNSGSWSHPIHIHFEEGIILRRDGKEPPEWEKWARKDVYRLGPQPDSGVMVEIALRFREFAGTFMEHCHNTQHEDHAMLMRWDIENPGQTLVMPTPIPSWDGVSYVDTHALPTFRTGDGKGHIGPSLDDQAVEVWLDNVEIQEIDLINLNIGDALNPTEDERGVAKYKLRRGVNIDNEGRQREVFFVLHDSSDIEVADKFGVAWAGRLIGTPDAATSQADYNPVTDTFTFYGDLPNPVTRTHLGFAHLNDPDIPAQSDDNDYSPLRRVMIDGKKVIVNAFFIKWGDRSWERLRTDVNCNPDVPGTFPDDPPNTSCMYAGEVWSGNTGQLLEVNTDTDEPYVKLKLHKSWAENGDYLPYYIIADAYPARPANGMGVVYVPKHEHLGRSAAPLVQFLPPEPINDSYPPTDANSESKGVDLTNQLAGGGPLGGQIGLPAYFMPEKNYSPLWHIGFAWWDIQNAKVEEITVIKHLRELKHLREEGKIKIHEWPGAEPNRFKGEYEDNYDFDSLNSAHVVNCPTPVTIDTISWKANKIHKELKKQD